MISPTELQFYQHPICSEVKRENARPGSPSLSKVEELENVSGRRSLFGQRNFLHPADLRIDPESSSAIFCQSSSAIAFFRN